MNYSISLPAEIVTEILLKLPAKSIVQFKTVCKFWYSIINDTHFAKRHLKLALSAPDNHHRTFLTICIYGRSHLNPLLLYNQDDDGTIHAKALDVPPEYGFYSPFNSCDGLLCFSDRDRNHIFVWNPCLPTLVKIIPTLPFPEDEIALGYDPKSDDYKIVKVPLYPRNEDEHLRVEIFSFKSNRWKTMQFPLSNSSNYLLMQGLVYANNRVHWLSEHCYRDNTSGCVIYFDLAEESLRRINSPPGRLYFSMLMNYKDSIAFAGDNLEPGLEYWVLKDYCGMKSSWNKIFSLNFIYLFDKLGLNSVGCSYYGLQVINSSYIGITLNGEIFFQRREGGLTIFDPKDGRLGDDVKGNKITRIDKCDCSFLPSRYVQSLLSPTQLQ